ncbi:MAG: copper resistance protein CopC [Rhodospirillales bacterium]
MAVLRTLAVLAFAVLALLGNGAALGHAVAVETVPPDGSVLAAAPAGVVIVFNEPVAAISAQVLDAGGRNVSRGMTVEGSRLRIALPPRLPDGRYVASYRIVSADGHPVGGSVAFAFGTAAGVGETAEEPHERGWRVAAVVVRVVLYTGMLGAAGGFIILLPAGEATAPARAAARQAAAMAVLGAAAAVAAAGVQGGLLAGGPASSLLGTAPWRLCLESVYGRTAIAAAAGLVLLAVGLSSGRRAVAAAGAAAVLAGFALSGHVATAAPAWLTVPALLLHAAAVAAWVGPLLPLRAAVARHGTAAAPLAGRTARLAVRALPVMVLAGVVVAVVQVGTLHGLVATEYGWFLLGKVAAVAAMVALAAGRRSRRARALRADAPGAAPALRRAIDVELGLAIAVLAATAALGTTPPPRVLRPVAVAAHGHHAVVRHATAENAGRRAAIEVTIAGHGTGTARIVLTGPGGARMPAAEVTVTTANPAAGVEPVRRPAVADGPGAWRTGDLVLVPPGLWTFRVEVLVNDFERADFETTLDLR